MSILIHHFVVHQLIVNNEGKMQLIPREGCLPVTPALEQLGQQLHHTFVSKPGKGVGHFIETEQEDASFSESLNGYTAHHEASPSDSDTVFVPFTKTAGDLLLKSLVDTGQVETGFVLFVHYEYLATQYLLVTLLNTKAHVEINQQLELNSREHLDLAKMQLAVRIDLTQYRIQSEQQRYVSFIKGRMGRKVSDFFMQFVGCEEKVDVKQQNKQLISSVETYLAGEGLDAEEKTAHRTEVSNYFKQQIDSGDSIRISELAEKLPRDEDNQRYFAQFTQGLETPIEPEVQPDPAAIRQLAKFSGQGGGVSLSFDRKLLGDRIIYHPDSDTLTIKGIPPNLKDQLKRNS
jgi:nucleoid-associated protein